MACVVLTAAGPTYLWKPDLLIALISFFSSDCEKARVKSHRLENYNTYLISKDGEDHIGQCKTRRCGALKLKIQFEVLIMRMEY